MKFRLNRQSRPMNKRFLRKCEEPYVRTHYESPELHHQGHEDDLVIENIVSTDFFAFRKTYIGKAEIHQEQPTFEASQQREETKGGRTSRISKYDDDKFPYTFLWWLAKTVKNTSRYFQPYALQTRCQNQEQHQLPHVAEELQHQYVEHIFHLQSPFNSEEE